MSSRAINSIVSLKSSFESILNDRTQVWHPYLCALETKCGVSKVNTFLLVCFLISLYLVFGLGAALLCNFVGVVFPAWRTLRALRCPNFQENSKLLTYWLVYAFLSLVDHFSVFMEQCCPLYWLLKCMFLLWSMSDVGAHGIYCCFLKPLSSAYFCCASYCTPRKCHRINEDVKIDDSYESPDDSRNVSQFRSNNVNVNVPN